MVEKIERICIVYGEKRVFDSFLKNNGIWWVGKELNIIEIDPRTEHFKELKHGLIKGFEE